MAGSEVCTQLDDFELIDVKSNRLQTYTLRIIEKRSRQFQLLNIESTWRDSRRTQDELEKERVFVKKPFTRGERVHLLIDQQPEVMSLSPHTLYWVL